MLTKRTVFNIIDEKMLAGKTTKEKRCNSWPRGIQNSTVQELIYSHHQVLHLALHADCPREREKKTKTEKRTTNIDKQINK